MTRTPVSRTAGGEADTLLAGFAHTVRRHPDRPAVVSDGRVLTYAELDAAARRLAAEIQARTVAPGSRIGILLHRDADLVVAAVAALQAGCAYLPLDPVNPRSRLARILDVAAPALVVTTTDLRDHLPPGTATLRLDGPRQPDLPYRLPTVRPDDCAYLIFTSGTTGQPKGVRISHGNVRHLFTATEALFRFDQHDVWSMFHSFAFDFAVWEMWGALLYGGAVVVVPETVATDPAAFRRLLREQRVTVLSQTPTAFGQLVTEEQRHDDRLPVRRVVFGGEALHFASLAPWIDRYGDETVELVNMYGITETTVHASYRRIRAVDLHQTASLIGRALPGSDLLLVDDRLAPVPPGEVGEIVVTGPGVGLGYHDQPELTRQRFVELADGAGLPVRGYRSGDLARLRPDGDLEYLGRADDQVKIRGFRIELGEIEAALLRHPSVAAAAVAVRPLPTGEPALVGYLVPAPGGRPDQRRLHADLSLALPGYMVPATFMVLAALPHTGNGKLDRAALPAPVLTGGGDTRPARSLTEELLCQVFAQVLGRPTVGPEDNFFVLGGHSLAAVRLTSRIRVVLGIEVGIQELFATPTVAGLAAGRGTPSRRHPLAGRARPESVPLSYAQQYLWSRHQRRGATAAHQSACSLTLAGRVDVPALDAALTDLAHRHAALGTRYPAQHGAPAPHPVARLPLAVERTEPEKLDDAVRGAAREPIDLERDPALRARLFVVAEDQSVLLLVAHHIAADEWSWQPLLGDLAEAYRARLAGRSPVWAPLPVRYADFAEWQRELLGDPDDPESVAGAQLAFWRGHLDGPPDGVALPVDGDQPGAPTPRSDRIRFDVDTDLHARLARLARASGTTIAMVLRATVAALLARSGAGSDIPLVVPVCGRFDDALTPLVGAVANPLVARVDTAGDPTFADLLARVRATELAVDAHQELPFGRLVGLLDPARPADRHPLARVLVAAIPAVPTELTLPGLASTVTPVSTGSSDYDLSVRFTAAQDADGRPQGMAGWLEYRVDLVRQETAERLATGLARLLALVAEQPGARLSELA